MFSLPTRPIAGAFVGESRFRFDDIFPNTLGKPIFTGVRQ